MSCFVQNKVSNDDASAEILAEIAEHLCTIALPSDSKRSVKFEHAIRDYIM